MLLLHDQVGIKLADIVYDRFDQLLHAFAGGPGPHNQVFAEEMVKQFHSRQPKKKETYCNVLVYRQ